MMPGGDGYNAWANGGIPPAGAPLAGSTVGVPLNNQGIPPTGYVPPSGQMYTVEPGGSQFMENMGGVELRCKDMQTGQEVPCPSAAPPAVKPSPTPKAPAGNTAVQPTPAPGATPKPMATPPPKNVKPATDQPNKAPANRPGKSGTPKISELPPGE
jgi:hypothetical protein